MQLAAFQKAWLTLQVTVPPEWIDAIFPGVRQLLQRVQARNARMQSGKGQADDLMSDKAAEGFLQTVLYSGICFWQNLPFRTQRLLSLHKALTCCLLAHKPHTSAALSLSCRFGVAYVLHRLPAVANIISTKEYSMFAQQIISSHEKANKQADMDVSPAMGDMLTEMQGCLKQLCGNSAVGNPEAVAQLIAEKMAAMNLGHNRVQDNCGELLTLPAPGPADIAAPTMHVELSAGAQGCNTAFLQAPTLYDTSGSINSVQLAWSEWRHGSTTMAERVKQIKADTTLVLARRNSSLHKKNRHLPQLIESLI